VITHLLLKLFQFKEHIITKEGEDSEKKIAYMNFLIVILLFLRLDRILF